MREYPKGGLIGKLVRTFRGISALRLPVHAANTGYFLILSVFPALVLLLSLLRYTPLRIESLVMMLEGVVPTALLPEAEQLVIRTYETTSKAVVSISAVTALWSASRGVYGLLTGLNAVYEVTESRGYFYTRGISVVYTFAFLVVLVLTLVLHVFGTALLELLETTAGSFWRFVTGMVDLRFFLLLFLQTALFTAMYTVLPNRRNRLRDSLPGAFFAAAGWQLFSHLYSLYVEYFPSYLSIYGSVYAVAITMLWLYFCILILFYGALVNRTLTALSR